MRGVRMKLIIDIDKEKYNQIINSYQGSNVRLKDYEIAIINGTPIPDNATNGDIIQAMFPEINKYFSNVIEWRLWWNAPYQKGKQ